ncbi:hypothetical protein E3N88_14058 [Mikania micrantha]|uniref:Transposase-associated domain-containing protein n=1 Tax=Mikania micrantha TaxID=192012 RepID=A0A5N6P1M3_9ASTR|nr:hypothetical protein E3N88_14058 [Mikania micrantha]
MQYQNRQSVLDHLICSGFRPEYLKWVYHGEGTTPASNSTTLNEDEDTLHHEICDLLNDAFEAEGEDGMDVHENDENTSKETNNKGSNFDDLVNDAEEKVYPNCKYNKLSCVVYLYHIKCLNGWSNKSFTILLEFLKDLLPEGNILPKTTQHKEDMYSLVKSKFVFLPNETNEIKKWILYSMGKKWRAWNGSLKARLYDPSLTVDEIVGQQVKKDKRVCQTQFKELATRWFTPKFQGKKDVWVTDFSNLGDIAI